jgi:hypothetical protein
VKKVLLLGLCVLFGGLGFVTLAALSLSGKGGAALTVPEILDNLANAAEDMKGKKVAPNIVVSGARVGNDLQLTFYYDVLDFQGGRIDTAVAERKSLELQEQVCSDRMMRKAIDGGAAMRYAYSNESGRIILEVLVDDAVCDRIG